MGTPQSRKKAAAIDAAMTRLGLQGKRRRQRHDSAQKTRKIKQYQKKLLDLQDSGTLKADKKIQERKQSQRQKKKEINWIFFVVISLLVLFCIFAFYQYVFQRKDNDDENIQFTQ